MMMTLPMKIKTNVSVVAAATVTLLMTTLLFKEASATSRQWEMITDKEAAAGGGLTLCQSLGNGLSSPHVPTSPLRMYAVTVNPTEIFQNRHLHIKAVMFRQQRDLMDLNPSTMFQNIHSQIKAVVFGN